jgi:tetrapyrrole methylase family protein/MazG family protein
MTAPAPAIIIAGLGPGNPELRTVGTRRALDEADRIILRTRVHPGLGDLVADPRVTDCDDLYEIADDFVALYAAIADRVVDAAHSGGSIVFAVPGHPRFGEKSVPLIEAGARNLGIPVVVLDAVSFLDVATSALAIDPIAGGLQVADAEEVAATVGADPFAAGHLGVDPSRPLLVAQLYNRDLASAVKIALSRLYPDEYAVVLLQAAGVPGEQITTELPLHALDRQQMDHLTSLWVPPMTPLEAHRSPSSLARIVARLRAPGGCPWDREQTPATLRNAVLEEAYEVVDAIDTDDYAGLAEELGDLLLLVTMHAQIAEENGEFRLEDVYEGISRKLTRRHPHVFGSVSAATADAVVATWEGVKAKERAEKGDSTAKLSPIDRLPRAMPVTRKIIEILAPRSILAPPENPNSGNQLLEAVRALIERGLDPELALEASLRESIDRGNSASENSAVAGIGTERGREFA